MKGRRKGKGAEKGKRGAGENVRDGKGSEKLDKEGKRKGNEGKY